MRNVSENDRPKFAIVTAYYKEDRSFLERCLRSVRQQSLAADHIVVADGFPQNWLDEAGVRHIRLDRRHGDYGNTARGVGALLAIAEDYVGIGFLDADNWLEPNHISECLAAAVTPSGEPYDYIIAQRNFKRPDETTLAVDDEPDHVDTNCFFFLPGAFYAIPRFAGIPRELSSLGDRIFYKELSAQPLRANVLKKKTVNYHCLWESLYRTANEAPPPDAKPNIDHQPLIAWLNGLSPAHRNAVARRLPASIANQQPTTAAPQPKPASSQPPHQGFTQPRGHLTDDQTERAPIAFAPVKSARSPQPELSSWVLPQGSPVVREPLRPVEFRQPSYLQEFDAHTLFYDVFRSPTGQQIVLLGPSAQGNLSPFMATLVFAASESGQGLPGKIVRKDRNLQIWLENCELIERLTVGNNVFGSKELKVQPNHSSRFADRRVLLTKSKNNDLDWIFDWVKFYRKAHGITGVLFYDNASTAYSTGAIENAIRSAASDIEVEVVPWPFKFGPNGGPAHQWDSDYCEYAILEHARHRYLTKARSVLHVDIDELVVSPKGESVFAFTERGDLGYTMLTGRWIANVSELSPNEKPRHRHYQFSDIEASLCPLKWCIVPSRCEFWQQWKTHEITGFGFAPVSPEKFSFRHFKAISTRSERSPLEFYDAERHQIDSALVANMQNVFGGFPRQAAE
jgi:Glycosyl transferase family 2